MGRIFHVDLDTFFVSAERVRNPSLVGIPVLVGGNPSGRGVVTCASYESRVYGVKAGMPVSVAMRICPSSTVVQSDLEYYKRISKEFFYILSEFCPFLETLGLDEAFLDMTGFETLYGLPSDSAQIIKKRISDQLGLLASIGIASSKPAAKIASGICKPDGLLEIPDGQDSQFLAPLPVDKLPGIGGVTEAKLQLMGIKNIGQLARSSNSTLMENFGKNGASFQLAAMGLDKTLVITKKNTKSMGRETTLEKNSKDIPYCKRVLRQLVEQVCFDLRNQRKKTKLVAIKLRWSDFTTLTRQTTSGSSSDSEDFLFSRAEELLARELVTEAKKQGRSVRLIGFRVGELEESDHQSNSITYPSVMPNCEAGLENALYDIRRKFGVASIRRGLRL